MKVYHCQACGAEMKEKPELCVICRSDDVKEVEKPDKSPEEIKEDELMKAAMEELDRYDEDTDPKDMKLSYSCPCEHDHS